MSNVIDQYRITQEPYYRPVADEVELYEAAYSVRMPMMLKGPTGCGKTRFVASCCQHRAPSGKTGRWPSPRATARSAISTKWWRRARTPPW
jgi:MoxR-like ATPase